MASLDGLGSYVKKNVRLVTNPGLLPQVLEKQVLATWFTFVKQYHSPQSRILFRAVQGDGGFFDHEPTGADRADVRE